jgi:hypothetical protein
MPQLSVVLENITNLSTRTEWDDDTVVVTQTIAAPDGKKGKKHKGVKSPRKKKTSDVLSHQEHYLQEYKEYTTLMEHPPTNAKVQKTGKQISVQEQLDKARNKVRQLADLNASSLQVTLGRCHCMKGRKQCVTRDAEAVFHSPETIAMISSKLPYLLKNILRHPHDKHYVYSKFPNVSKAIACMLTHMDHAPFKHFDDPPATPDGKDRQIREAHVADMDEYQREVQQNGKPFLLSLHDLDMDKKAAPAGEKRRRVECWKDKLHDCKSVEKQLEEEVLKAQHDEEESGAKPSKPLTQKQPRVRKVIEKAPLPIHEEDNTPLPAENDDMPFHEEEEDMPFHEEEEDMPFHDEGEDMPFHEEEEDMLFHEEEGDHGLSGENDVDEEEEY